jgi:hypothetical protein
MPFSYAFFATVQTFFRRPNCPLVSFMIFFLRAFEATVFTDLGIFTHFFRYGDFLSTEILDEP